MNRARFGGIFACGPEEEKRGTGGGFFIFLSLLLLLLLLLGDVITQKLDYKTQGELSRRLQLQNPGRLFVKRRNPT